MTWAEMEAGFDAVAESHCSGLCGGVEERNARRNIEPVSVDRKRDRHWVMKLPARGAFELDLHRVRDVLGAA
jgi:hypothetical protein